MSDTHSWHANLLSEVEVPKNGILSRTLYGDDNVNVVIFGFDTGQELSEHTASVPAIIHILSGECDLTLGTEKVSATPGSWAHLAANTPHTVVAKTPMVMLLTMLKSAR